MSRSADRHFPKSFRMGMWQLKQSFLLQINREFILYVLFFLSFLLPPPPIWKLKSSILPMLGTYCTITPQPQSKVLFSYFLEVCLEVNFTFLYCRRLILRQRKQSRPFLNNTIKTGVILGKSSPILLYINLETFKDNSFRYGHGAEIIYLLWRRIFRCSGYFPFSI